MINNYFYILGIENIYLDYKQLCKAAQKSKLFIAEYEEKGAFKFLETNRSLPVVETSEFSRGKIQKGSIENILKIIQDEGSDLHSKFRTIQYGNKMKALWTVPCLLSNNKIIYFSNGFKNENINMHFIFGKVVKGEFLSLLAAIGKSQVEILSQQRLDCHYLSQLRNKSKFLWIRVIYSNYGLKVNNLLYVLMNNMSSRCFHYNISE